MRTSQNPPRRPTIGLFVDSLFSPYQETLRNSVMQETEAADVNLLCFLAGPSWQHHSMLIYELAGPETVDGIIAVTGSSQFGKLAGLGGDVADRLFERFFRQYGSIPVVSIGRYVPGRANVLVRNADGLSQVLDHLIEVHGRRRIAFIRGPAGNEEAEARLAAYRSALERHGLEYQEERVFQGNFLWGSGTGAVTAFMDQRRIAFDAIVAANDCMAVAALQELQHRKVRIPGDVAVVGFDDTRQAVAVSPSLTTVRQPLWEMGRTAVKHVLAMIRGDAVPEITRMGTHPVIRGSCGCLLRLEDEEQRREIAPGAKAPPGDDPRAALAVELERLFPEVKDEIRAPSWASDLAGDIYDGLEALPHQTDLEAVRLVVARGMEHGFTSHRWRRILRSAFAAVERWTGGRYAPRLDRLQECALDLVGDMGEKAHASFHLALAQETGVLQDIFRPTGVEADEVRQALERELPRMGIRSLYLARHTGTLEEAVLDFHFSQSEDVALEPSPGAYPSRRLVPGRFSQDHRWAHAVLPLHSGPEQMGFAVCELGSVAGITFETMGCQLARALKASTLMNEVKRHAGELESMVEQRTRQLSEAQQHLVEVGHQAGMAEIAVGVMHNIGNLLNGVNISAQEILRAVTRSHLGGVAKLGGLLRAGQGGPAGAPGPQSRPDPLADYCDRLSATLEGEQRQMQREAEELLDRMALIRETIRTMQEYARDGKDLLLTESLDLQAAIEMALEIQADNAAREGVEIRKQFESVPPVTGQRAKIVHVLVNLIKNAIEAMRNKPAGSRSLLIELACQGSAGVLIRVSDTGEGIAQENLSKIFSYGFTTKPDGHGFGLHLCANHLSQMGGSISASSEGSGRGATFSLVFRTSDPSPAFALFGGEIHRPSGSLPPASP